MAQGVAEKVLELATRRFGAAEVFEQSGESTEVEFEDNRLKTISSSQFHGIGLRVIHKGRIGFASTTDLRSPQRLVEMAAASAQFGDEAKFEFPGQPEALPDVPLWDDGVLQVPVQRMVEIGREGLEMSRAASDAYLYGCSVWRSAGEGRLLNSAGLDVRSRGTAMGASVHVQEVTDDGLLQVYEFKSWRTPTQTVTDLTQRVLDKMRMARRVVPARMETIPMLFHPKAVGVLLGPLLVAINGKTVQKGASVLKDRVGEQVLDDRITLVDDPTLPYAPSSCPTDGEGLTARRYELFTDWVLRGYLTDLQTAALLGCEPSGRGLRGYSSRPAPGTTNLLMSTGDTPTEDLVAGLDRAVIIEQTLGAGQSNVLAGEFSVNVELGLLVENGQVVGRVKDCMVAGNVYEVLRRVEALASDAVWYGSRCVPAVLVGGLKLAAKG